MVAPAGDKAPAKGRRGSVTKAFAPPMLGQERFDVVQYDVGGATGKSVSRKVTIAVTGMGIGIFDDGAPATAPPAASLLIRPAAGRVKSPAPRGQASR